MRTAAIARAAAASALQPLLQQAVEQLQREDLEAAQRSLDAIIRRWPTQPDALHFMGVLRHTQGRTAEAVALIRRALQAMPDNAGAWNNLGNVLLLAGRSEEAGQAYAESVRHAASDDEAARALNNLSTLHRKLGALDRSEQAAREALARKPDFGDAWYSLSLTLIKQQRIHDGLLAHSRAVALWPQSLQPRHEIIRALMLLGELGRASVLLRQWQAEDPDNPVAAHLLSACGDAHDTPQRASDRYVQQVFDSFAASFDVKLQALNYRAPGLVVQALQAAVGTPRGDLVICDAGCGTGLCAPGLAPFARQLAGCDLSIGMLRRAKLLGLYQVLHQAELTHYLSTQPGTFDAVVSADTLCYFGALDEAMAAAHCALKPGGWLVFTAEALPETDRAPHRLQSNGRYAHASVHLHEAMRDAGFEHQRIQADHLRLEAGEPVRGWVVSAQRRATQAPT